MERGRHKKGGVEAHSSVLSGGHSPVLRQNMSFSLGRDIMTYFESFGRNPLLPCLNHNHLLLTHRLLPPIRPPPKPLCLPIPPCRSQQLLFLVIGHSQRQMFLSAPARGIPPLSQEPALCGFDRDRCRMTSCSLMPSLEVSPSRKCARHLQMIDFADELDLIHLMQLSVSAKSFALVLHVPVRVHTTVTSAERFAV